MKKIIALLIFTIITVGFTKPTENEIKKVEWILGKWERQTSNGTLYEHWTKLSDSELSAKNYMVRSGKTSLLETIQLVSDNDGLFFIPTVGDQNNAQPVKFKLKTLSNTMFEFENKEHDFPQYISYRKVGADSLIAEISGLVNGKMQRRQFNMKRAQ